MNTIISDITTPEPGFRKSADTAPAPVERVDPPTAPTGGPDPADAPHGHVDASDDGPADAPEPGFRSKDDRSQPGQPAEHAPHSLARPASAASAASSPRDGGGRLAVSIDTHLARWLAAVGARSVQGATPRESRSGAFAIRTRRITTRDARDAVLITVHHRARPTAIVMMTWGIGSLVHLTRHFAALLAEMAALDPGSPATAVAADARRIVETISPPTAHPERAAAEQRAEDRRDSDEPRRPGEPPRSWSAVTRRERS